MPNYQNGKIYSIRSRSRPDLVYVGSTTQPLSKRLGEHKTPRKKTSSKQIIELGDAYIELIENYSCENKEELLKREGEIMRSMECLNKYNPIYIKCPHNRGKTYCKECRGVSICIHNRDKSRCKVCGGSQVCIHKRIKSQCKECNNYYCKFCDKSYGGKSYFKKHNNSTTHMKNYIQY